MGVAAAAATSEVGHPAPADAADARIAAAVADARRSTSFAEVSAWALANLPHALADTSEEASIRRGSGRASARLVRFEFVRPTVWVRKVRWTLAGPLGLANRNDPTDGEYAFVGWLGYLEIVVEGGHWWNRRFLERLGIRPIFTFQGGLEQAFCVEFGMLGADWVRLAVMERLRAQP